MTPAENAGDGPKIPVLLFLSAGRQYGVRVSTVREVVEIESMQPIEGEAEDYIGVMVLRNEPIPLVAIQGDPETPPANIPMCIVMQRGHAVIGLAVERVLGIHKFGPAHAMKGLVATDQPQYAYLDANGRLVQAIDADRWFNAQASLPLLTDQRALRPIDDDEFDDEEAEQTYMALTVGERLFAVASNLVDRAIDDIGLVPLPRRPGVRIDSVIEVSGNVLPVLRFSDEHVDRQLIYIIVNFYEQKWAIAAERVLGIVSDESPGRHGEDEIRARVISHKGAFHEVIDLPGLIASKVPDFIRPDAQRT